MAANHHPHQGHRIRTLIFVLLFGILSILGSNGDGGTSSDGGDTNRGWLTLTYPTEEASYPTDTSPQYLMQHVIERYILVE